jgi:hypothetical protein
MRPKAGGLSDTGRGGRGTSGTPGGHRATKFLAAAYSWHTMRAPPERNGGASQCQPP